MLLTVPFRKSQASSARHLSTHEWARLAVWLRDRELEPSALLNGDLHSVLSGWTDSSITLPRLECLLGRGGALALSLEKWERAGLWVIARSDLEYPKRLKRRLRTKSPPVLFGCGNKRLLDRGGIAVVGSRNAAKDDLDFTEKLGKSAAQQGLSIVSGGARGVDQSAMLSTLQSAGTAIGVLADSLLRAVTSNPYRDYLISNDLVLITPFHPEARFNVGNAMSRNRYIYCLADAAVAVSSTPQRGGTWNGAIEDLKEQWVPLWVKHTTKANSGNSYLVKEGARWIPDDLTSIDCLLDNLHGNAEAGSGSDQILSAAKEERPPGKQRREAVSMVAETALQPIRPLKRATANSEPAGASTPGQIDADFYSVFLSKLRDITADGPVKTDDIAVVLKLEKMQVRTWVKRAVSEGKIKKLTRPVRYQSTSSFQEQECLFSNDA